MLKQICVCVLLWMSASVQAQSTFADAHALVAEKINGLMAKIETSKGQATLSEQEKIQLVEAEIGDVVDFKRIARRVMAKYFRQATKEQKYAFLAVFKSSLLNTYAKGLWEFNDYKVNLLPLNIANQSLKNTQVEFEVVTSSGQVFPVNQSLYYSKKHSRWLVQNVIINGINMGLLFREQFARLVAQNNGEIDLAIANWQAKQVSSQSPDETKVDH